jgi:hypothetical protein
MWFGADPGGKNIFAIAALAADGGIRSECVSCADEALEWMIASGSKPRGLGIDCPMWWSSHGSGDRRADKWLRRRYRDLKISSTVMATNSLSGSVLIQGVMLAWRAREHYADLPITEAHPKILIKALDLYDWSAIAARFSLHDDEPHTIHQRDAVLAAVAAREGFSGNWTNDLSRDFHPRELNPQQMWLGPVHYFWPET